MFGDSDDDAELKATWEAFCDRLKQTGDIVFRDTTPTNPVTRATGLRILAQNIALGLQFEFENCDPRHPLLMRYFGPERKQGGDNTDALYVGAPINGTDTYRLFGNRGSSAYFAITVLENGATPWGGGVVGALFGPDIETDADGNFEVVISPEPHAGNWIKSSPDTWRVTIRQFFADWENEEPMTARIDRLGDDVTPPTPLTAEGLSAGLERAVEWVDWSLNYWADTIDKWKARRNEFLSFGEVEKEKMDFTPGGVPMITYWQVPHDEALILRVMPPHSDYWACEFGNYWWTTMDYHRNHLSNTNQHYASLEDNGELIVVIAHDDPGLPNWLDPAGHDQGYVTFRWIGADHSPRPECVQVKASELLDHLPAGVKRISKAERVEQLKGRWAGVCKRFRA